MFFFHVLAEAGLKFCQLVETLVWYSLNFGRYIRIGNGNQLIRDPKKRTRLLASEKVRWSLHTARLRLARKRKYCQFFTRFGRCNKDSGRCPYLHDPSKIAVCTKFLNGSCSNDNCKLTHKVYLSHMRMQFSLSFPQSSPNNFDAVCAKLFLLLLT